MSRAQDPGFGMASVQFCAPITSYARTLSLEGHEAMTSVATLQPEPAPIVACTISRDVQNFDLLIDDMELELGESWGDLSFDDAEVFLNQPEAAVLEFVAIAVDHQDEADLSRITEIIRSEEHTSELQSQ